MQRSPLARAAAAPLLLLLLRGPAAPAEAAAGLDLGRSGASLGLGHFRTGQLLGAGRSEGPGEVREVHVAHVKNLRQLRRGEPSVADEWVKNLNDTLQADPAVANATKKMEDGWNKGIADTVQNINDTMKALNDTFMAPPLDYNAETMVPYLPISLESLCACVWVSLIASVPLVLVFLVGAKMTRAHKLESMGLVAWLGTTLYMFTHRLNFSSIHFDHARPLTIVEAVYLLTQILTTVGYGDIVPAEDWARVGVASSVVVAICLYGSLLMEVSGLIEERMAQAIAAAAAERVDAAALAEEIEQEKKDPLKADWDPSDDPVDTTDLMKSALFFSMCATGGVFFFRNFPGENKDWMQAIYMSVITLSTVGFGDVTPTTEGGKIFGAFWMLFGVASLANLVGGFVKYMRQVKARERRNAEREKLQFFTFLRYSSHFEEEFGEYYMDEYEFFRFGLLTLHITNEKDLRRIEDRWASLGPDEDGKVSYETLRLMEGPPATRRRAVKEAQEATMAGTGEAEGGVDGDEDA